MPHIGLTNVTTELLLVHVTHRLRTQPLYPSTRMSSLPRVIEVVIELKTHDTGQRLLLFRLSTIGTPPTKNPMQSIQCQMNKYKTLFQPDATSGRRITAGCFDRMNMPTLQIDHKQTDHQHQSPVARSVLQRQQ